MPVQKYDTREVRRPSGLVPPLVDLRGVTEIRLHGVGGTTPENLLADAAPQLVSGNGIAGFFRTADFGDRHVEAYSWGGLTSRNASRVFWLLLFPFTLSNLAGWMCSPAAWRTPWRFRVHRTAVRWAALGTTVNLLLLVAMTTMDLIGYQCGARAACVDRWWLRWLGMGPLPDHPGLRVLFGAVAPVVVVLGLWALAGRSLRRYEGVAPPRSADDPGQERPMTATVARPNVGLDDPDFWNGGRSVGDLAVLHTGVGLAFVAWIVGYTVRAIPAQAGVPLRADGLDTWVTALAVAAVAAAAVLLHLDSVPRPSAWMVLGLGVVALGCAVVFALAQPPPGVAELGTAAGSPSGSPPASYPLFPSGTLPGVRGAVNWTYGFCTGAALVVLAAAPISGRHKGGFVTAGPFVAVALGQLLLNGVGMGAMIRVADVLGTVAPPGTTRVRPDPLYVYDLVYAVTPYLTLLPAAIVVVFVLIKAVALWHAARPSRCESIRDAYARMASPDPVTRWDRSAARDDGNRPRSAWNRLCRPGWAAGIARGRRIALMTREIDKLLTVIAFVAVGALGYVWVGFLGYDRLPYAPAWMLTISTWLAAALPVGVLILIGQGWRGLSSRRHIGVMWDVGTFWPRAYHPLAPPSYAERAVPELQRRLWYLRDNQGAVVLAAHSQGCVIAAAALLQDRSRPGDDDVAMVTFGSPLGKFYGWAFPAYFGAAALAAMRLRVWRWRNFYYDTDYIGGPVLPELDPDAPDNPDQRLDDPPTAWYVYGQEPPALGRHTGYWVDPTVWQMVDRYAAELPVPTAPRVPGTRMAPTCAPDPAGPRGRPGTATAGGCRGTGW